VVQAEQVVVMELQVQTLFLTGILPTVVVVEEETLMQQV
jgi:hypothetical protein